MSKEKKVLSYKELSLEDMIEYIEDNYSGKQLEEMKKKFKSVAIENGKYSHFKAKSFFCTEVFPELKPVVEKKENKSKMLENW